MNRLARLILYPVLLVGVIGATLGGCSTPKTDQFPQGPPPSVEEVLAKQHAAVDGLDRLWARAVVRVEGNDADGNWLAEQAEGVLQVVPPNRLALSLGKLNRTRLLLGSNEDYYWWFDMLSDTDRVALIGRQALVTPEKTERLGLPVHPLDLIELLAITPLPETIEVAGYDARGRVVVRHASRWGTREVSYETTDWKPVRVRLLDDAGEVLVEADLNGHERAWIEGDATRRPWVADNIEIRARGFDGMVRMTLFDPENKTIRDAAFDLPTLAEKVYKINRYLDLDAPQAEDEGDAIEVDASEVDAGEVPAAASDAPEGGSR